MVTKRPTSRPEWHDPDDAPPWTEEQAARAQFSRGGEVIRPATGTLTRSFESSQLAPTTSVGSKLPFPADRQGRYTAGVSAGKRAASATSKVLRDPKASKEAKSAAASALMQRGSKTGERTNAKIAAAASKVLRDPKASKEAKSVAASALTQTADKPKKTASSQRKKKVG